MKQLVIFFLIGVFIFSVNAQEDCKKLTGKKAGASGNNKCCKQDASDADSVLMFDNLPSYHEVIADKHTPFGLPKTKSINVIILYSRDYLLGYDTLHKITSWVQYKLSAKDEIDKSIKRTDCFRFDPRLSEDVQVGYQDYKNQANLQRGHMKPSNDSKKTRTENINSFVMTNMVPQYGQLNQCEWLMLEDFITDHSQADSVKNAWVISGSAFGNREIQNIGGAAIPHYFYKIYFFESNTQWHYWTFFFIHDDKLEPVPDFITELQENHLSIRGIEKICRVNFYVIKKGINKIEKNNYDSFDYDWLPDKYNGWCNKYLKGE